MAVLSFTLSEEGVAAFRDALICLNKFSDDVSMEARKDSVRLTAPFVSVVTTNKYQSSSLPPSTRPSLPTLASASRRQSSSLDISTKAVVNFGKGSIAVCISEYVAPLSCLSVSSF